MICNRCSCLISSIEAYKEQTFFDEVFCKHVWLFEYQASREILHASKYRGEFCHYKHLSKALAQMIKTASPFSLEDSVLTFVPTIESHVKLRGFDHAYELAKSVGKVLKMRAYPALIPTHGLSQTRMNKLNRYNNPHFLPRISFEGKNAVLIDDTASTRSTLFRAGQALKDSGVSKIMFVTIASRSKQ